MSNASVLFLFGAMALAIGCRSTSRAGTRMSRASPCLITAEELRQSGASSLYEALVLLRPNLLRARHGESSVLIIDGVVRSDVSAALHVLPVSGIAVVRRLSAAQATQRYALRQNDTVLEVLTFVTREHDGPSSPAGCS
jgi:hypothetical protein